MPVAAFNLTMSVFCSVNFPGVESVDSPLIDTVVIRTDNLVLSTELKM